MDKRFMAIVDIKNVDAATYIQAKKRYCPRYFSGHRGFVVPVEVVEIAKLTYIKRNNMNYIQHHLINPIVVCKMTSEQWAGPKNGNLPFRDPSCQVIINDDGYIYAVSRGNKRLASLIALGYTHIDAYVCDTMEDTFELGKKLEEEYNTVYI